MPPSLLIQVTFHHNVIPTCPHPSPLHQAAHRFVRIQEAWETLRDPEKRREYDQRLAEQGGNNITGGGFISEDLEVRRSRVGSSV